MRRLIAQDSHIPELAAATVPAQMTGTDDGWEAFRHYRAEAELAPRPLRLLTRPEPIEAVAEVPDGPPLRFRWRRALHEVIAAEGPERIEGAWWSEHGGHPSNLARDYFRVEDKSGPALLAVPRRALPRLDAGRFGARRRGADLVPARDVCVRRMRARKMRYLEFAAASNFSFLRGASHPEELMVQAAHLGLAGLGLCDRNSVAGVVRAHLAKREQNLSCALSPGRAAGVRRRHARHSRLPARPRRLGQALCRLLTLGNLRAEKGDCILSSTICWRMRSGLNWSRWAANARAAFAPAHHRAPAACGWPPRCSIAGATGRGWRAFKEPGARRATCR